MRTGFFTYSFEKLLLCIVVLGLCARLYRVTIPLGDWHSFRQSDTASVTREYVKHGIDLLHPKYQDLSNVQSGVRVHGEDNVQGWRMVEFPFINALIALVLRSWESLDLVIVSRLFSIFFSLVSVIGIAYLGKWLFSSKIGLFSGLFFALNPFSIYYGRVILPEPYLVAFLVWSAVVLQIYVQQRTLGRRLFFATVFAALFSCSLLLKPTAIFYGTFFLAVLIRSAGIRAIFDPILMLAGSISVVPLLLWRQWITQYPSGIPVNSWLYNGNGIRLRPSWFYWLFYERLTKTLLGYVGVLFFLPYIAFVRSHKWKDLSFFVLGGVGLLAYLIVFATGNVQHEYYQVILLPYLSLCIGYSAAYIHEKKHGALLVTLLFLCSFGIAYYRIRRYTNINNWEIVHAGQAVDRLTPSNAKVIAPYTGDTAFLFATNRTGWSVGFAIDTKIAEGATHYVSVVYDDEARALEKKYVTLEKTSEYILIDLTKPL